MPVTYGTTGAVALLVDQDGQLYQKGLGPQIARMASRRESFHPQGWWSGVKPCVACLL
ncbi:DUF2950 family protein [Paraburkholderia sp.]|uniref:DUF2950 family protein n=1 Tax=Paraburkholderia sp. TaxID=1926495 RepID=UPI002F40801C